MSHGCKFYQKIIDINATAIDHDVTVKATSCMKAGKSNLNHSLTSLLPRSPLEPRPHYACAPYSYK
jgi:hypothetical protein